jgi:hypothetical protein
MCRVSATLTEKQEKNTTSHTVQFSYNKWYAWKWMDTAEQKEAQKQK